MHRATQRATLVDTVGFAVSYTAVPQVNSCCGSVEEVAVDCRARLPSMVVGEKLGSHIRPPIQEAHRAFSGAHTDTDSRRRVWLRGSPC